MVTSTYLGARKRQKGVLWLTLPMVLPLVLLHLLRFQWPMGLWFLTLVLVLLMEVLVWWLMVVTEVEVEGRWRLDRDRS